MTKGSRLGELEELALLSVLRLGDDAHGASVRALLADEAERSVSISTVYVTLMRLEEKGYVRSHMGEPTAERGGRAKRHFAVTAEGMQAVEAVREVRARLWSALETDAPGGSHAG